MKQASISKRTRQLLKQYGLSPKKQLGQNFLTNEYVLERIIRAAEIHSDVGVLEIGPGLGALTEQLAKNAKQVIAIELDARLIPILEELFQADANVTVIQGDILKIDVNQLLEQFKDVCDVYVVANLPYYITSPVLIRLLQNRYPLQRIVVMVQKEVAARLTAKPGSKEYGALSVFAQYYAKVHHVFTVPKHVFVPQPKVESSVVRFDLLASPSVKVENESLFFQLVRASFAKRRKTLVNALYAAYSSFLSKKEIQTLLEAAQIDPQRRGETCSLEEFARLTAVFLDFFPQHQDFSLEV